MQKKTCNPANFGGKRTKTLYIVVHFTGNLGDSAKNNADYFARASVGASAHFFVDEHEIWASVPQDYIAWHCGAKQYRHPNCRNANSIGVEICMHDKNGHLRNKSISHAAQLVHTLLKQYNLGVTQVLRHYDVTGKLCPQPMVQSPTLWQNFLDMIKHDETKQEDSKMYYRYYEEMPDWAKPTISKLVKKGYLKGEGNGVLNLSEDVLKVLVINDRAGAYGC